MTDFGPFTPGFGSCRTATPPRSRPPSTTTPSPCCSSRSRARPASSSRRPATSPAVRELCTAARTCCSSPTRSSPASAAPARRFACDHEGVVPDMYCWARRSVAASCRSPRSSSTDDVLGRAPARASTARPSGATRWRARSAARSSTLLATGEFQERAAALGAHLPTRLAALRRPRRASRGARPRPVGRHRHRPRARRRGREVCERLMARGVLVKDTHGSTIRFAPPLVDQRGRPRLGGRAARRGAGRGALSPLSGRACGTMGGWLAMSSRAWSSRRMPRAGGAPRASAAQWSRMR